MFKRFGEAADATQMGGSGQPLHSLKLNGEALIEPYGIVAVDTRSELYVADRAGRRVMRVTLSGAGNLLEEVVSLEQPPTGINTRGSDASELVVAAGDSIYVVSNIAGAAAASPSMAVLALKVTGANFVGVSIAPAALGRALYAIDYCTTATLCSRWHVMTPARADSALVTHSSRVGTPPTMKAHGMRAPPARHLCGSQPLAALFTTTSSSATQATGVLAR